MLRSIFLSFILLLLAGSAFAQDEPDSTASKPDSGKVPVIDTAKPVVRKPININTAVNTDTLETLDTLLAKDTVSLKPWIFPDQTIDIAIPAMVQLLAQHPYFNFEARPVIVHSNLKQFKGKEILFYTLIGFLLMFSFLRHAFPKYFNDLFRVLFRRTLKQKQLREQLMQTPLPSFLLNTFFVFSGGLYINLLLNYYGNAPIDNFWLLFLYCSLGLGAIYAVKFVGLNVSGWLFNMKGAAGVYSFIVFMINKVIGVFLLPFLIVLSFAKGDTFNVTLVLSWCVIGGLFIYRYFLTYTSVRNQVRFNPFHFFLYLCAFEIAPLLLIYKALLFFFRQN